MTKLEMLKANEKDLLASIEKEKARNEKSLKDNGHEDILALYLLKQFEIMLSDTQAEMQRIESIK